MDVVRFKIVDSSIRANITDTLINVYGVDKVYVDGSLGLRDASIIDLYDYTLDLSTRIDNFDPDQDPSIPYLYDYTLDLSTRIDNFDPAQDPSITDLYATKQDLIPDGTFVKESSLGTDFVWNAGLLDVSIISTDGSVNDLYNFVEDLSTRIGTQDSSIPYLYDYTLDLSTRIDNFDPAQDPSISDLYDEISVLDGSLSDKVDKTTYSGTASAWINSGGSFVDVYTVDGTLGGSVLVGPSEIAVSFSDSWDQTFGFRPDKAVSYYPIEYDGVDEDWTSDAALVTKGYGNANYDQAPAIASLSDWNIAEDASIDELRNKDISQDASLVLKADKSYVDGSLGERDTSIAWLNSNKSGKIGDTAAGETSLVVYQFPTTSNYIRQLKAGNNIVLSTQGAAPDTEYVRIDASLGDYASKIYVDGSLTNKMNLKPSDVSFGSSIWTLGWDATYQTITRFHGETGPYGPYILHKGINPLILLETSAGFPYEQRWIKWNEDSYVDNKFAIKSYVDGSLNAKQDIIPDGTYVKEASLGDGLVWNAGLLDVSVASSGGDFMPLHEITPVPGSGDLVMYESSLNEAYQSTSWRLRLADTSTYFLFQDGTWTRLNVISKAGASFALINQPTSGPTTSRILYDSADTYVDANFVPNASLGLINTNLDNIETSLGVLNNWNVSQDASIGLVNTNLDNIETSLGVLNNWNVSQDASIGLVNTNLDNIEASIADTTDITGLFLKEASLGTDFYFESGLLEVSIGIGDYASLVYVDGSLAVQTAWNTSQDASIVALRNTDISQDASIVLKANTADIYSKTYIDGSLNAKVNRTLFDSSILSLTNKDISQDASLGLRPLTTYVDGSLAVQTSWNTSQDASISALRTKDTNIDTSLGLMVPKEGATMTGALVAADHGTASTDEVVNVCYGTGAAPTANTTTIGTIYIQYTA